MKTQKDQRYSSEQTIEIQNPNISLQVKKQEMNLNLTGSEMLILIVSLMVFVISLIIVLGWYNKFLLTLKKG